MNKLKSGLLIVFEGIDGSGKSTLCKLCSDKLTAMGYDCVLLKEPTDGQYGRQIRELAVKGRDKITPMNEFNLFLKDRIEDIKNNISPNLKKNKIILLDRYYYSTIAYQGALGIDIEFIRKENEKIAPKPDIVFYISIPTKLSAERITKSRKDTINLFEKEKYLTKVKTIFDQMKDREIVSIDGTKTIEEVLEKILFHIEQKINEIFILTSESDNV